MGYREEYEKQQAVLRKELDTLLKTEDQKTLEKRFFKNFGCINFREEEFMHELGLARLFHDWHAKLHPELHDKHEKEPMRCYHVTTCKCGFEEACDSSD